MQVDECYKFKIIGSMSMLLGTIGIYFNLKFLSDLSPILFFGGIGLIAYGLTKAKFKDKKYQGKFQKSIKRTSKVWLLFVFSLIIAGLAWKFFNSVIPVFIILIFVDLPILIWLDYDFLRSFYNLIEQVTKTKRK